VKGETRRGCLMSKSMGGLLRKRQRSLSFYIRRDFLDKMRKYQLSNAVIRLSVFRGRHGKLIYLSWKSSNSEKKTYSRKMRFLLS
jgi:hypothetical protein